jgi:hypothetical protein
MNTRPHHARTMPFQEATALFDYTIALPA